MKTKDAVIAGLLVVVVGGAVAGLGFYGDEVSSFTRLQAWNLEPVKSGTRDFLAAAAKGDGATAEKYVGPESGDMRPVRKNGRLVSFLVADYGGPKDRTLKNLAPRPDPKIADPHIVFLEGGAVTVEAKYPAHLLTLRWDRLAAGWKIIKIDYVATR